MATTQKPESTAVARPALPPEIQAHVDQRKLRNAAAQAIRNQSWSKDFDSNTMRAVANWCYQNEIDPVTEIDVLGGNIHIKARYYERQLAKLIGAGRVEYARKDWVNVDERLDTLAANGDQWAIAESVRRTRERILHNLSDEADAACIYRIKPVGMLEEVTGAKQHIKGRKIKINKRDGGSFEKDADPVGDQAPAETVETRALRRAMLQLADVLPGVRIARTSDEGAVEVQAVITESKPLQVTSGQQIVSEPVEHMPRARIVQAEDRDHYGTEASAPLGSADYGSESFEQVVE